jgi:hypothetical protein
MISVEPKQLVKHLRQRGGAIQIRCRRSVSRPHAREPPTIQWFHACRSVTTDHDHLPCPWRRLLHIRRDGRSRYSELKHPDSRAGLSAAAISRHASRGRATSTRISAHRAQPHGAVLEPPVAFQGQVRRSVAQLAEHVEDRPCLGGDLQVPENKADIAQSRPGLCCGHSGSTRCVIGQCATKQSFRFCGVR